MQAPSDRHYYEPSKGHGLAHDPLNAIVGPRPIVSAEVDRYVGVPGYEDKIDIPQDRHIPDSP